MLITRHLDYSLPYRTLLSGRGLTIPYLGERVLDALVGLLVRSTSPASSGATARCRTPCSARRRRAVGLRDRRRDRRAVPGAQRRAARARPADRRPRTSPAGCSTSRRRPLPPTSTRGRSRLQIEDRYATLWAELTDRPSSRRARPTASSSGSQRLHELGFDVEEMEIVDAGDGGRLRYIPRVVEHGYHADRLQNLTGLETTENQARRLLDDIQAFGAELQSSANEAQRPQAASRGRSPRTWSPCAGSTTGSSRCWTGSRRAVRQARAGRDLPPAARTPLVPVRGGTGRHRSRTCSSRTSTTSSSTRPDEFRQLDRDDTAELDGDSRPRPRSTDASRAGSRYVARYESRS